MSTANESIEPHSSPPNEPTESAHPAKAAAQAVELALAERDANHQKWMMALADLDNYRRRARKEAEEQRRFAVLPLAEDLLPALDNLQRAIQAAAGASEIGKLLEGVQMVARQFEEVLSKHQITPIEALGKPFDPNFHRALQQIPSPDHPPMTVLTEYERGYTMHDRVVRPSTVIVAAPSA